MSVQYGSKYRMVTPYWDKAPIQGGVYVFLQDRPYRHVIMFSNDPRFCGGPLINTTIKFPQDLAYQWMIRLSKIEKRVKDHFVLFTTQNIKGIVL